MNKVKNFILQEPAFLFGVLTSCLFYVYKNELLTSLGGDLRTSGLFIWIFFTMLWCSFKVVHHADSLAERLGEPYGTLILTLSVITIEVSAIGSVMLVGDNDPALARDTMFAVLMIVLNGMVGLSLLLGGWKHQEQYYNLQGAISFLTVIVTLAVLTLILPKFTISTQAPTFTPIQEGFFATITIVLYGVFLSIQTMRHRSHFLPPDVNKEEKHPPEMHAGKHAIDSGKSISYHAILLF